MAEKTGESNNPIPWPTVLVLLVAAGGLLTYMSPLKSDRPEGKASPPLGVLGYQDVDARLWQDPLSTALEFRDRHPREQETPRAGGLSVPAWLFPPKPGDPLHQVSSLQQQILERSGGKAELVIMPVMLEGGPYPEASESRRRCRNAVLSGLIRARYVPWDGQHLGFVELEDWPRLPASPAAPAAGWAAPPGIPLVMPYEWCRHQDEQRRHVLLIWLNEDWFADRPLNRLASVLRRIVPPAAGPAEGLVAGNLAAPKVRILGPRTSTTLQAMTGEALTAWPEPGNCPAGFSPLRGAEIYSATATADVRLIADRFRRSTPPPRLVTATGRLDLPRLLWDVAEIRFERTLADDTALAQALVGELRLRGVDAATDYIAVVSESDTFYGRMLPVTFESVAKGVGPAQALRAYASDGAAGRPRQAGRGIEYFSYLRGIDGRLAGEPAGAPGGRGGAEPKAGDKETGKTAAGPAPGAGQEQAEGQSQYDYLRRLADELVRRDAESKAGGGGGLKAVGVLGSDLYDKLLVLQALRPRFAGVVFFTTEMDARLCSPAEWKATHNLVVASSYDLRVRPDLQDRILPFRDCYQTSLFCATLKAMRVGVLGKPVSLDLQPPRLFEIGRSGAYDLGDAPPWPAQSAAVAQTAAVARATAVAQTAAVARAAAAGGAGPGGARGPDDEPRADLRGRTSISLHPGPGRPRGWWRSHPLAVVSRCSLVVASAALAAALLAWLRRIDPAATGRLRQRLWHRAFGIAVAVVYLVCCAGWLLTWGALFGARGPEWSGAARILGLVSAFVPIATAGVWWWRWHWRRRPAARARPWRELLGWAGTCTALSILYCVLWTVAPARGGRGWDSTPILLPLLFATIPLAAALLAWPGRFEPVGRWAAFGCIAALFVTAVITAGSMAAGPDRPDADGWFLTAAQVLAAVGPPVLFGAVLLGKLWRRPREGSAPWRPYAVLSAVLALLLVWIAAFGAGVEPVAAFEGVSLWPSELIRLAAGVLSFHYLLKAGRALREEEDDLTRKYCLGCAEATPAECTGSTEKPVRVFPLWSQYRLQSAGPARRRRYLAAAAAYMLLCFFFSFLFGFPHVPGRGALSWWAHWVIFLCTFGLLSALTFFVADVTILTAGFIRGLGAGPTLWPLPRLLKKAQDRGMDTCDLDDYMDVRFLGKLTRPVMRIIYYPFVVLTLLILSRLGIFADWDWPLSIILTLAISSSIALFSAAAMRRAAEGMRRDAVKRLRQKALRLHTRSDAERAEKIRGTIKEIESCREGAFASFSQNPVLGALLLSSGAGIWAVLEYIARLS